MRRILRALALLAGLATAGNPAMAKNRALLIGVSDYPKETVGDLQLAGPRNDVALMVESLRGAGFRDADMTLLGDGLEKAGLPAAPAATREAVLKALGRLADDAANGDQVLVFLSGHGSQQPDETPEAKTNPSPDGLERLFLPFDIGPWNDSVGRVENAITAEEIGAAIRRIRDKGALVWLVVDACHSGGLTRGAEPDSIAKKLDMDRLGIPRARIDAARAKAAVRNRSGAGPGTSGASGFESAGAPANGSFVGFYAAHADQVALQRNLPRGFSADKKPQGVLTYYLVQAMRSGRASSFRDLALHVMSGYEQWGAQAPVPQFRGDLGQRWPGAQEGGERRFAVNWRGKEAVLGGGLLDDVTAGTRLDVFDPTDLAIPLGEAMVTDSRAHEAGLALTPAAGRPIAPDQVLVARVSQRATSLILTVARPPEAELAAAPFFSAALGEESDLPVTLVPAHAAADIRLRIADGRLYFVQEDAALETTGRAATASRPLGADQASTRRALMEGLRTIVRARNLLRVSELMAQQGAGAQKDLAIKAFLVRPQLLPQTPGALSADDRPCENLARDRMPPNAEPLDREGDSLATPDLAHCDMLYFELRNTGPSVLDVTPLYIDGGGGIAYMGPPEGMRIEPGAQARVLSMRIVTWNTRRKAPEPIGLERLVFLTVPQPAREALPADFRYLAQPTLQQTTRSAAPSPLRNLLESATFGSGKTRSANAGAELGGAFASLYRWRVLAP